jgi:hypothetical protein
MKNTIITGAVALAFTAPAFAGEEVVTSKTVIQPPAETCNLGFTGEIGVGYQSDAYFRGLTGKTFNDKTADVIIADANFGYAFTENFSLVAATTLRSATGGDGQWASPIIGDLKSYSAGVLWKTEMYSVEVGYQYHDSDNELNFSEIYANAGFICPWTGASLNLLYTYGLGGSGELENADVIADGQFLELSASKAWDLTSCLAVDLSAGVSYSFDYWSTQDTWNSYYVTLGLPVKATDSLTVTPYVTYTDGLGAMDPVELGWHEKTQQDRVFWGVRASVKF